MRLLCPYPSRDGEECEEDCADDVGAAEGVLLARLGPGHAHDQEGQEVEAGPHGGEAEVGQHVVLPCLDARHLLKEPGREKKGKMS